MTITDVLVKIQDHLSEEEYTVLDNYFNHLLYSCTDDYVLMPIGDYYQEKLSLRKDYDDLRQALVELLDDY